MRRPKLANIGALAIPISTNGIRVAPAAPPAGRASPASGRTPPCDVQDGVPNLIPPIVKRPTFPLRSKADYGLPRRCPTPKLKGFASALAGRMASILGNSSNDHIDDEDQHSDFRKSGDPSNRRVHHGNMRQTARGHGRYKRLVLAHGNSCACIADRAGRRICGGHGCA